MIIDVVIVRRGDAVDASAFSALDRPGYLGIRAQSSDSTIYLPLGQLEYLIDEARRAHPTHSNPKETER